MNKREKFLKLIDNLEMRISPEHDTYFYRNGQLIFNIVRSDLNVFKYIWTVFEFEYGMNHNEIKKFLKYMVEEHFKVKINNVKQFS